MRAWRSRAAAAVLALVVMVGMVLAGCGDASVNGVGARSDGTSGPGTDVPGTTAAAPAGSPLRKDLLPVAEMRTFGSYGYDLREVPVVDAAKWDMTKLRGACGADLRTPFVAGRDSKLFFSAVALIVEASAPYDDAAKTFFEQVQADLRVGCPSYDDPTAFGAEVVLSSAVDLPTIGTDRVAWTLTIVGAERTGLRQLVVAHDDERIMMLVVTTGPPAPPEQFPKLAVAALGG